jgi:hypothetical protein
MAVVGAIGALPSTFGVDVRAQSPAVKFDVRAASGLVVSPVYEGWYEVDGTTYVLFGYYNRNTEQIVDVPVGPQNHLAPGPADQGQPTRFFPGMTYGVFAVAVPKGQPKTEVTWTLTANGQTLSIPASLDPLYLIAPQREDASAYPGNTPPVVRFDPTGPAAQGPRGIVASRTATVSRPLVLEARVTDDGLPPRRPGIKPPASVRSLHLGAWGVVLSWQVYRGAGAVQFSNDSPEVEQATARTTVTFSEPGEYMLHLLAIDSRSATRCCWTNAYVKVTVQRGAGSR